MSLCYCFAAAFCLFVATVNAGPIAWKECLHQKSDWYGGTEAVRIADNLLLFQRDTGGWGKNVDMAVILDENAKDALLREKSLTNDSTIDNGATYRQAAY